MDQPTTSIELEQDQNPPVEPKDIPPASDVSKELFDKYKSDSLKFQQDLKAKEAELEQMKMAKLKESKNWQEIARIKEEEAQKYQQESKALRDAVVNQHKSMALRTAAQKAGINPSSLDDLDMLDMPEVNVETTSTGKILIHGAEAAILRLKTLRPHWFLKNPSAVNPQSPEVKPPGSGGVDLNAILLLEKEYKKNPQNMEARRAYESALKNFKR